MRLLATAALVAALFLSGCSHIQKTIGVDDLDVEAAAIGGCATYDATLDVLTRLNIAGQSVSNQDMTEKVLPVRLKVGPVCTNPVSVSRAAEFALETEILIYVAELIALKNQALEDAPPQSFITVIELLVQVLLSGQLEEAKVDAARTAMQEDLKATHTRFDNRILAIQNMIKV